MGRAIGGSAEKARVIAAAQGVDDIDGHALAGLIDAEGSFSVRSNNGGRSWVCGMTLVQRADDADVLADIVRVTGIGRLHFNPAYRTSRPQVIWSVGSKLECRELGQLLRRYPLRGRKRREFEIWARAAERWTESLHGSPGRTAHALMGSYASEIRRLRRYVDFQDATGRDQDVVSESIGDLRAYLGGFFSGEGSFRLAGTASATINLRADDIDLLRSFSQTFNLGRVTVSRSAGRNPTARWTICRKAELPRAISLLSAAVLRGRKRREFEAWRLGAEQIARGRERDHAVVESAAVALASARAYVARGAALPASRDATAAYSDVLRAFAAEVIDRPLTCSAYAEARRRHPEWPTRNTIALAFGTWDAGLRAVGLGSRASSWARARGR
jgi:LAGLIDADG DNA endonuclease family protein